jgi:hypothetical protein
LYQDSYDLPPQLEDYRRLVDLVSYTDLTDNVNEFNSDLQGDKKAVIEMTGIVNSSKEKRSYGRTSQLKMC